MIRAFLAFVKKETFHILRDRRTLFILFGMPVALVLIFGYTITNEFKDASIAVLDQAQDDLSESLVEELTASGHFKLIEAVPDIATLEAAFRKGKVKMALVIPVDFERKFYAENSASVQLISDATEPNYAATITEYASRIIRQFQHRHADIPDKTYSIDIETRMLYNPMLIGAYTFIPGVIALILMLISAMMTSLTIAREKEHGTMDLLLVSPLPPMLIILGKVTPYVVLAFLDALMILAMGYVIFEVPVVGSLALLLVLCVLYLLVALALGVLISTRAESQQTAMMMSLFTLLLPTMLLSGFIFPIASMPPLLQYVSKIIPAKYFIIIEKGVMLKGAGWQSIYPQALVLVLMTVVLLAAAWKNFKVVYK
jgi:ABC-2 type transport system permease protein